MQSYPGILDKPVSKSKTKTQLDISTYCLIFSGSKVITFSKLFKIISEKKKKKFIE